MMVFEKVTFIVNVAKTKLFHLTLNLIRQNARIKNLMVVEEKSIGLESTSHYGRVIVIPKWEAEHNFVLADYKPRFRFKQNP